MGDLKACFTGLKEIPSGYNAFFDQELDMEKVFSDKGREALAKLKLEVKLPPKMKSAEN